MTQIHPAEPSSDRNAPLDVLHVYKIYLPDIKGGVPMVIRQLATGMAAHCRASILAARARGTPRRVMVDGIPVRRTLALCNVLSLPIAPLYPLRLWQMARRSDLMVHHVPFPLVDVAISLWFPKRCGLVVHWHSEVHASSAAQQRVLPLLRGVIARTLRRADRIIVPSAAMIEQSPFLGPFAQKCEVVPYGIDIAYWSELSPSELRQVRDIRSQYPRLVVTAGRLVSMKGFDVLIESFAGVDGQLMILGAGPLEADLRALVEARGLGDRVQITGRSYDRGEFKYALHAARVFVMPSLAETFGLVQLEAMACGRAVVNTRLPTLVPLVARHEREALTVSPGSAAELTAALGALLTDEARCTALGQNGLRRVTETFGEAAYFARTLQIYREVVAARRAR
ncbi:MAG TPA: glycosyltransferase [Stellaceae bacterium]|nr:glycosyltransferase [Stellaceae bacterium]